MPGIFHSYDGAARKGSTAQKLGDPSPKKPLEKDGKRLRGGGGGGAKSSLGGKLEAAGDKNIGMDLAELRQIRDDIVGARAPSASVVPHGVAADLEAKTAELAIVTGKVAALEAKLAEKEELAEKHANENKALRETLAAVDVKRERAEATAEHYKERSDDLSAQNKDLFARLLNWN